jgi:hypothetical protein
LNEQRISFFVVKISWKNIFYRVKFLLLSEKISQKTRITLGELMTPVTKSGLPITPPSNRNPKQADPAVVARAMEMLKAQREPNSPPLTRPGISITAQQSLSLPDGQYIGDVKDGVPHGRGKLKDRKFKHVSPLFTKRKPLSQLIAFFICDQFLPIRELI